MGFDLLAYIPTKTHNGVVLLDRSLLLDCTGKWAYYSSETYVTFVIKKTNCLVGQFICSSFKET